MCILLLYLRSSLPWHYPISPKNGKPALSPHHDWLKTGSQRQNAPLRIWFYPQ
ncbi:transcriptional regulator [Escherichia coli]|nr:transcriptional regulator [Escherichia coli]MDI0490643.1 transcriptional regulator [Escherichia coli]MDI0550055.1 transcriptional regulator [Escherichia coli]MDI0555045.1 transcriptional regulator [Escherichia coli]MDI0652650.1 transcriptional regulator [Escherichia coli]MDI0780294.1 transcriptional regulator [Escherichia coli]